MKSIARLSLFFSACFIIFFFFSSFIRVLAQWVGLARFLVNPPEIQDFASLLMEALIPALFISILLSLSYAARRRILFPVSMLCLLVLAFGLALGFSMAISRVKGVIPPVPHEVIRGEPGLILSRSDTAMVLLKTPQDARGPRVVSLPNQALLYQELPLGPGNSILSLPALAFRDEMTWILNSLLIDFSLTARQFTLILGMGILPFSFYLFALIFFLVSLRFILELGSWPLANIFLGALVFRGILALGTLLDSPEITGFLASSLGGRFPQSLITPLIFVTLGLFVLIYTILAHFARGRRETDENDEN
jgi:hypothetical protein